jgi:CheY-like chemotaxis protein
VRGQAQRRQELARILLGGVHQPAPVIRSTPGSAPKARVSEPPRSRRGQARAESPKSPRNKGTGDAAPKSLRPGQGSGAAPKSLRGGATTPTPTPAPTPVGDRGGPTVIVIDDDAAIRELIVKTLSKDNCVYQAADGQTGLSLLRRLRSVDVVLCDVSMPKVDGYAVARAIKADPELRGIPVIFLTALDAAADHVAGIQAGACSYLTKPFKIKELRQAMARAQRRG